VIDGGGWKPYSLNQYCILLIADLFTSFLSAGDLQQHFFAYLLLRSIDRIISHTRRKPDSMPVESATSVLEVPQEN